MSLERIISSGHTTVTVFHQLFMTARVPFCLHEYNPTILQAAALLACACALLLTPPCHHINDGREEQRGEAALPCLLGVNVVVIILPEVGACSAASCFLLWCAYMCWSFRLPHDGKGHRAAINHCVAHMRSQSFFSSWFYVIAVIFWPYFCIHIYRFHSFHATNVLQRP